MAVKGGPNIGNDGLVLCLDAHDAKSYAGEPTTNFFYRETPRIDSSYSTYVHASNSTWAANHPDALIVYNTDGTAISSYVNQGANSGNWQVIAHAHWVYDNDLRKPVVKMHRVSGYEGQWRALSRNLGHNLSQLGLTAGDKFTISWLQKAYVEGVYARAGIYMRNTGGSNGFHAGQAYSSDVGQLSSELGKWAHKSKTFTVPSGMNETGYNVGLYMYGHYSPTNNNTIYISDVQVEKGDYATPIVQGVSSSNSGYWGTRSATNGWVDRSGNSNHGTLVNMAGTGTSHYRDGQVIMPVTNSYLDFDGTNDCITLPNDIGYTDAVSVFAWFKRDTNTGVLGGYHIICATTPLELSVNQGGNYLRNGIEVNGTRYVSNDGSTIGTGTWHYVGFTWSTSDYYKRSYIDGVNVGTQSTGSTGTSNYSFSGRSLGSWNGGTYALNGKIALYQVYNKALTQAEVLNNYNTTKGRFS